MMTTIEDELKIFFRNQSKEHAAKIAYSEAMYPIRKKVLLGCGFKYEEKKNDWVYTNHDGITFAISNNSLRHSSDSDWDKLIGSFCKWSVDFILDEDFR